MIKRLMKPKIYKVTIFGRKFLMGFFPYADKWYHMFDVIY